MEQRLIGGGLILPATLEGREMLFQVVMERFNRDAI